MADRNQSDDTSIAKSAPSKGETNRTEAGSDDGIEKNADPDSEKSSSSRPRGHTEDPDRTL